MFFLQFYPFFFNLRFSIQPLRSHYNRWHYCSSILLARSFAKAVFDRLYPWPFLSHLRISLFFSIGWLLRGGEMRSRKCPGGRIKRGEFLFSFFFLCIFFLPRLLLLLLLIHSLSSYFFFITFLIFISLHFMFMFIIRKCKVLCSFSVQIAHS